MKKPARRRGSSSTPVQTRRLHHAVSVVAIAASRRGLLAKPDDPDDGFGYMADLKREARAQAALLGHVLVPFVARHYTAAAVDSHCERCLRMAVVHAEQAPHIYGPAVSGPCPGESAR